MNEVPHKIENLVDERFANLQTAKYQIKDIITKLGYVHNGQTYWKYMKDIFIQIIYHNICKANKIQNNQDEIEDSKYRQCFEELDLVEILRVQNMASQDAYTGYIWVLNTCVFFVPEYNFTLVARSNSR